LTVATAGSLIGALLLYGVGRLGGRPLVLRLGPLLRISPDQLERADAWFDRRGAWIVVLGRLVPGARSIVSIPAGMSEMPLVHFGLLTTVGSLTWNAVLIGVGQSLGANWAGRGRLGRRRLDARAYRPRGGGHRARRSRGSSLGPAPNGLARRRPYSPRPRDQPMTALPLPPTSALVLGPAVSLTDASSGPPSR